MTSALTAASEFESTSDTGSVTLADLISPSLSFPACKMGLIQYQPQRVW